MGAWRVARIARVATIAPPPATKPLAIAPAPQAVFVPPATVDVPKREVEPRHAAHAKPVKRAHATHPAARVDLDAPLPPK